jgi:hypothetical protein
MQALGDLVGGAQDRDAVAFFDMLDGRVNCRGEVVGRECLVWLLDKAALDRPLDPSRSSAHKRFPYKSVVLYRKLLAAATAIRRNVPPNVVLETLNSGSVQKSLPGGPGFRWLG